MTIDWMRDMLAFKVPKYSGSVTWQEKVRNFSDAQVYAVYHHFKENGLFDPVPLKKDTEEFHQITIFEYLKGVQHEKN